MTNCLRPSFSKPQLAAALKSGETTAALTQLSPTAPEIFTRYKYLSPSSSV